MNLPSVNSFSFFFLSVAVESRLTGREIECGVEDNFDEKNEQIVNENLSLISKIKYIIVSRKQSVFINIDSLLFQR